MPTFSTPPCLLPLGALAAGFGLLQAAALAQTPPAGPETTLAPISVKAQAETDANSLRASTTQLGKGTQDLRDIPQSLTVLTQKLLADRRVDTLKEALHLAAGISFQAGEGGEEDVRLRGFSLATSGDIYVDGLRDPAFYDRDTFAFDRVEVLRGSASMLFGRGSTGGVVNQVQKPALLADTHAVQASVGTGGYARLTGDFNLQTSATAGLRINLMDTQAQQRGNFIDKQGGALNRRWGVGQADEFTLAAFYLRNHNGMPYGVPWLRRSSNQASANPSSLIPGLDPAHYYAAASDYNRSTAQHATLGHQHRFDNGAEWKTVLRPGRYSRDQRASAIRFCQRSVSAATGVVNNPDCPTPIVAADTVGPQTLLTRGTNNRVQDMGTLYAQSDFSRTLPGPGGEHALLAGMDLAQEIFNGYATVLPAGVTLDKNRVRATLGTPDDGSGWVDESLRQKRRQARFEARSLGLYAQDLWQFAPNWKLLAGLRHDQVRGRYQTFATADVGAGTGPAPGTETARRERSDGLWSQRAGLLYQPDDNTSWHVSYGNSFNTSGDTYQYDLPGSNTPPEASRNLELGAKIDALDGRLSTRWAVFHTTKTNERNRDSPAGTPLADYLLSGRRHAAGAELEMAGRLAPGWEVFGSYAWIPVARIDRGNADGTTLTGELVGQRPSLTPRHSGSLWTTWQATPALRLGAGLNARSPQTPNRNPPGIVAPGFATADLLAEYTAAPGLSLKLNVLNATNKLYADGLYTAHYLPGAPRSVQLSLLTRF